MTRGQRIALAATAALVVCAVVMVWGPRSEAPRVEGPARRPPDDALAAEERVEPVPSAPAGAVPATSDDRVAVQHDDAARLRVVARGRGPSGDVPVADVLFLLRQGERRRSARTGADGAATLPLPQDDVCELEVRPPDAWIATPGVRTLRRSDWEAERELVVELIPRPSAPLRGRLVDSATGEALGGERLRLWQATVGEVTDVWSRRDVGEFERVETDAQGLVVSTEPYFDGILAFQLDILVAQGRRLPSGEVRFQAESGTTLELPLPIGPAYVVQLTGRVPAEAEALSAGLGSLRAGHGFRDAGVPSRIEWLGPQRVAVRFPAPASSVLLEPPPWGLRIATRDGRASGLTRVGRLTGQVGELLHVALVDCGAVAGRVLESGGEPAIHARVELEPMDPAQGPSAVDASFASEWLGPGGSFSIEGVPAGTWRARAACANHRTTELVVEVRPGEVSTLEFRLELLPPELGSAGVSGALTSSSGRFDDPTIVRLREPGSQAWSQYTEVRWRGAPGDVRGDYAFRTVSPGVEYELSACSQSSDGERITLWSPMSARTKAPDDGLDFFLDDANRPSVRLWIRAADAQTDSLLRSRMVWSLDPMFGAPQTIVHSNSSEWVLADPGSLRDPGQLGPWLLESPGYQPVLLTSGDFSEDLGETLAGQPGLGARVALHAGWGDLIVATDEDGLPLAAVEILLDGELFGTTDESGRALVTSGFVPREVALRKSGWTVVSSAVRPNPSNVDRAPGPLRVVLRQGSE